MTTSGLSSNMSVDLLMTAITDDLVAPLSEDVTVSHKGGRAGLGARAIKQAMISRLLGSGMTIRNESCDHYVAGQNGNSIPFSFRVTAKSKARAWFNVSHRELARLAEDDSVLLVLFNPSRSSVESLWAFIVSSRLLLCEIRKCLPSLILAKLSQAIDKLTGAGHVPALVSRLRDLRDAAHAGITPERAETLRIGAVEALKEVSDSVKPIGLSDESWEAIRRQLAGFRETLQGVLVYIQPQDDSSCAVVSLPHSDGHQFELDGSYIRKILLTGTERHTIHCALNESAG